jgi:hypothetical protein
VKKVCFRVAKSKKVNATQLHFAFELVATKYVAQNFATARREHFSAEKGGKNARFFAIFRPFSPAPRGWPVIR